LVNIISQTNYFTSLILLRGGPHRTRGENVGELLLQRLNEFAPDKQLRSSPSDNNSRRLVDPRRNERLRAGTV